MTPSGLITLLVLFAIFIGWTVVEARSERRAQAIKEQQSLKREEAAAAEKAHHLNYPPVPEVSDAPSATTARLMTIANLGWAGFWIFLLLPFVRHAGMLFSGSWEAIMTAPGAMLYAGLNDIEALSPAYGFFLVAFVLAATIARIKAGKVGRNALLRVRMVLMLVAVFGAIIAIRQIAATADEVFRLGGVEIPDDDVAFRNTMLAELARAAAFTDFETEIAAELVSGNVERAGVLVSAADLLGRPIPPALRRQYDEAASFWSLEGLKRNASRCAAGGLLRRPETITHLACMVIVDFVPVPYFGVSSGDALDLGFQIGGNLLYDTPYDPTITSLAAIGITIDLLFADDDEMQQLQPGLSAIKASIRSARHMAMAPGVERGLRRLAANVVDPAEVSKVTVFNATATMRKAFHADGFAAFRPVLSDLHQMYRQTGNITTPLLAMRHADDLAELSHFRRTASIFGKQADGVIDFLGKNWKRAFWKAGKAGAKATAELAAWYAALAASVTTFLIALSTGATSWLLKRLTFRWARRSAKP